MISGLEYRRMIQLQAGPLYLDRAQAVAAEPRSAIGLHLPDGSGGSASGPLAALAATSCSIIVTDATRPDNPISYANAAFSRLSGYPTAEILGRNCRFLQGPETDPQTRAEIGAAVADGYSIRREILNYRRDGTTYWADLTIDPIRDPAGAIIGFIGTQREADAVRRAIEARIEAESRLSSIADHIPGFVYRRVMRADGTIALAYANSSLSRMLELGRVDAARSFYEFVHPDDRDALFAAIRRSAAQMSTFQEEFRLIARSGAVHWIRSASSPRRMAGGEIVWDGLALEISAEKRWQTEITDLAMRDPLTGLLTRKAWQQTVVTRLAADTKSPSRCSLINIDIAALGELNARLGQATGDAILREVAQRIAAIAASVAGLAGRVGGDEFAILVPARTRNGELARLAQATSQALARPMVLDGQTVTMGTYVGASIRATAGGPGATAHDVAAELMTQAELALRWAKQAGRNQAIVYSTALDDRFRNTAMLTSSLERAIADDQLELHYQPIVDLASGRILSAEALVRWNHPALGMQRPDQFIGIAEKSGLVLPLGRWVIEQAIRQRRLWCEAGLAPPPIAINLSGAQLVDPGFVDHVSGTLKANAAEGRHFEFELIESQLIEASPQVLAALHALRDLGFAITIDDFGSGHASFRYLRDFPLDKVKIDQMFVRKLVLGSSDELIIRAVLSLARGLGIAFVAEGIETEMQRDFLEREGCEIGQGYLFSQPLAAEDFAWMLANDVTLPALCPAASAVPALGHGAPPVRRAGGT
jgi:diguanylate cyclase (GGDEF)-like protein/PAS domain S-box-containing protein